MNNHTNHDELKKPFIQILLSLQYIVSFYIKIVNRALDQKVATKYEIVKHV